jgi:hypothetical protein
MTSLAAPTVVHPTRVPCAGVRRHAGALGIPLVVGILAATHGGYFATSWGWSTLVFAWAAAMALLLRSRVSLSRNELSLLAAASCLVAWIALSILWSSVRVESLDELERGLVYLSALFALLLVVRVGSVAQLLAGTAAAITIVCGYALLTRLLPDRVGTFDSIAAYRLSDPVGYWNALGIFAAIGAVLALGFAARAERLAGRAAAAASLPVLLLALEFTFSRGSWLALGVGIAAAVAFDTRRLQLLALTIVVAPPSALGVWLASRSHPLTTVRSSLTGAAHDGHRLVLVLLGLTAVSAGLAVSVSLLEARLQPGQRARRVFTVVLLTATVGGAATLAVSYGNPVLLARKAVRSFESGPVRGAQLNERLFSLSSNGRIDLWRAALHEFEAHPVLGGGAGSFEQYWRAHRTTTLDVRDAHSLYLETLAELGLVGLALLALTLGIPFLAARHRGMRFVPFALAAYTAYLVHAGIDWDWEMPAITLAGLFCGAAALVATRDAQPARRSLTPGLRYGGIALIAVIGVFSLTALIGNRAAASSVSAAAAGKWSQAASDARTAQTWLPWSSEPQRLLGDAEFGRGDFAAAALDYRLALGSDPRNWELWYDLGFATSGAESAAAFARASALDPLNPEIPRVRQEATHVAR